MPLDIYKKTPIVIPSDEHVVLDSLGGRLVSKSLLDKSTNDRFGSTIDAAVADVLLPVRALLDAKAADGRSAPTLRGVTAADGQKFNLLAGGKPEMAAPKVQVQETDKGVSVCGQVRGMGEAKRLLARKLAEHGIKPEAIERGARSVEEHVPMLHFDLQFGPAAWRGILKMACNLLAHGHPSVFLDAAFDPVRKLVLQGEGDPWDFLAFNTSPVDISSEGAGLGAVDHLVIVQGDAVTGSVHAFVALYGHLQFVLRLGVTPLESSFVTSYRVDQLGGCDRLDAAPDIAIGLPLFTRYSELEYPRWLESMGAGMRKLMPVVMAKQREHAVRAMVEKSMTEVLGPPDGQPITEEQHEEFARRVMERYMRLLDHEGVFDQDD